MKTKKIFVTHKDHESPLKVDWGTIVVILFSIYVIGAHLRISLYSGNSILVPMYLMIFSGGLMFLFSSNALIIAAGNNIILLSSFLVAQPIFSWIFGARHEVSITSSLQLIASILSSVAFLWSLARVNPTSIWRLSFIFWAVLIILAILETYGLRPIFDSVKEVIYAGTDRGLYAAELRDLEIYGTVRPTVFASEPSFLADSICGLAILMYMLDPQRGMLPSWIRLGAMFTACSIVSPSFKIIFYIASVLLWQYWPTKARMQAFVSITLVICTLLLWLVNPSLLPLLESAIGQHGETGSFYGRVEVGPEVAAKALVTSPFWGYGLGGADEVYSIISNIWFNSGAFQKFPWYIDMGAKELMSNGFWWQWVFLGLAGGIVFIILLIRLMADIGITMPMRALVCTWIVWYAGSAFVDPQSWYMLIIFSIGSMRTFSSESNTSRMAS